MYLKKKNIKNSLVELQFYYIIQQHLNIMQSTYELLTSDFVELEMTLLDCV